jgi:hypothetical protein
MNCSGYEAFGMRTAEAGTNLDPQRGNTKDEDPTGLSNQGHRYLQMLATPGKIRDAERCRERDGVCRHPNALPSSGQDFGASSRTI